MTFPSEAYLWFKTLHIVGVVVWFAGLFYLVRLFIYHVGVEEFDLELREPFCRQYGLMERRLANIITTPGMVLTIVMAIGLLAIQPDWMNQGWMRAKLGLVVVLIAYHSLCYRLMGQLAVGTCHWTSQQLRALNELPTLILILAVTLVIFKSQFPTSAATWLLVGLIILIAASIRFYARWRRLRHEAKLVETVHGT